GTIASLSATSGGCAAAAGPVRRGSRGDLGVRGVQSWPRPVHGGGPGGGPVPAGPDSPAGGDRRFGGGGSTVAVAAGGGRTVARGVPKGRSRRGGPPQAVRGDRGVWGGPRGRSCPAAAGGGPPPPRTCLQRPFPARDRGRGPGRRGSVQPGHRPAL